MRFTSIASGSSGNCTYIGSDNTHVLVDAGVSKKRIEEGLKALELGLSDIDAIFVTHEHSDHIAALRTILKKFDIPIYATEGTIEGIKNTDKKNEMVDSRFIPITCDKEIILGDMKINPMVISHDALEPCGYRFFMGDKKVGITTDLGCYSDYTVECLKDCDALLLEANHDVRMLQTGPYPYVLKTRILGDRGHLSNEKSGELLCKLLNDKMKGVFLGHLSKENNLPELAYETVRVEIEMGDNPYHGNDFPLIVADRSSISPILEF
ncbi:MAG: MBL fold metallo-hydrolase [Butyrivibrio sp.]|jgi:phosphoribosyl 1,2-cyclic phosphodiesterase|uniref:MBL fold metallo-hydrolase n=1 Tax=Butyrivibrio sp. TaxID=28121 RepID=UPI001ED16983|nr:MBL fold metallo-hydrolase [Butyrivibrio sp.]MBE5840276.1 MBL fold metallo-hydrolase [Butyrivibrio sp.]